MKSPIRRSIMVGGVLVALSGLAACGPKSTPAPPPPPPPPPPPVVYVPPRPFPPLGAAAALAIPAIGADGVRQTVNAHVLPAQAVWNLRSAYNVAALNCQRPEHADILAGYKKFLKTNAKALTAANRGVDADFRKRYGAGFIRPREAYMTQVYNYYAFPPTLPGFCDAALVMSRDSQTIKPSELAAFSARNLAMLDTVFENFFRSYETYRAQAAAWDAKYGPPSSTTAMPTTTAAVPVTR